MTSHVLVIEDEPTLARSIQAYLTRQGCNVELAACATSGLHSFHQKKPDITILDYQLGKINGLDVLREIRRIDNEAQVVMMTAHGNIELAVNAMKAGAREFLTKPVPLTTLKEIVVRTKATGRPSAATPWPKTGLGTIVGRSSAINELRRAIDQIIVGVNKLQSNPPPVMITGEPGTGKKLIAKVLHTDGPRRRQKMVRIDCAALSELEIEQLLFLPFNKGAQESSDEGSRFLKEANGGILFFDEVSHLSPSLQANLLAFLENISSEMLSLDGVRPLDLWILSSTSRPLPALTQNGAFKKALLFRLQTLWLETPALRHRDSDALFLAEHFLMKTAQRYDGRRQELTPEARAKLMDYRWPGNVGELQSVVERASLLATGEKIEAECIRFSAHCNLSDDTLVTLPDEGLPLETVEHNLLQQALERTRWNVSKAAALLGLSRDQMRYRIQKFKLDHKTK